jgi:hypothetical protein
MPRNAVLADLGTCDRLFNFLAWVRMAPRKPHIARTYAPIHFDDLDPHRFEDLVRELIYDFKEWQAI